MKASHVFGTKEVSHATRGVQFCTEQFSGVRRIANNLGLGHVGLHYDRGAAPFYVTWDGTAWSADSNASQRGASKGTPFVNMPAHARVGSSELINRQTNTTGPNPLGWDQPRALTGAEDFRLPARGVSKRFDIPMQAAGGVAFDGADNLFGIDVEVIWA